MRGSRAIILYGPRAAPFVEPVVRTLALKRLAFELREPQGSEDYWRWSPETGQLPVADIEGERVQELTEILLRLDQHCPHPPLLSDEPRAAAAQLQLAKWVSETFSWYWARSQRVRADGNLGPGPEPISAPSLGGGEPREPPRPRGVSLRDWLGRRLRNPDADAPEVARLAYEIGHRVDDIARLLGERKFFFADQVGMADLIVYGALRTVSANRIPGTDSHLARHPRLGRFIRRVDQATAGGPA